VGCKPAAAGVTQTLGTVCEYMVWRQQRLLHIPWLCMYDCAPWWLLQTNHAIDRHENIGQPV
jgi:hypothetical protein